MQMIDETREENWGGGIVIALFLIFVAVNFSACGEIYVGHRRIDSYERSERMIDKPLICNFTNCKEGK